MQREYWFIIIAGILSGTIVFGGQIFVNMGLSLYQISILPLLFVFLLLPFVIFKKECRIKKDMIKVFIIYGLINSILCLLQFGSVILGVPVAIVVLLLYTQPLWTIILSKFFLKEEITKKKIISMMIVLLGVFFLVNPFKLASVGNLSGIIVALIGGIFLSAWIITGRICGKRKIHPITIKFGQSIFMFLFLIISYPIMSFFVKDSSITSFSLNLNIKIWVYLLIFEIFSFITPHLFYFKGIQKVTASDAGVILLLEPVSGSILATLFLNQPLTLNIILGGLFILFSNYLVIRKK